MLNSKANILELSQFVHVWYGSFSKNESKLPELKKLISENEKKRAASFKFKKDRNNYIISRGILRLLLGNYLNQDPVKLTFEYTFYGKPYLPKNEICFNVSHSEDMVAIAFVLGLQIGVDIERIKDDLDILELAKNYFSKIEIKSLEKQLKKELPRAFFRCWTRKEAFVKSEGSGLSFPLDKFTVSLENDEKAVLLETQWDTLEKDKWSLFSFTPVFGYLGAIALKRVGVKIKYFDWDLM